MSRRAQPRTVSVAVPEAVDRAFTYSLPDEWVDAPVPGTRVLVPFGSRSLVGVVRPADPDAEVSAKLKPVIDVIDPLDRPSLPADVVNLCEWVRDYYMAPVGEAYRLALPGLLANADERTIRLSDAGRTASLGPLAGVAAGALEPWDLRLLDALAVAGGEMSTGELARLDPRVPSLFRRIGELDSKGLVTTRWDDERRARTERAFARSDLLRGVGGDEEAIRTRLGRSKARRALLDDLENRPRGTFVAISELRGRFSRVSELVRPLVAAGLVIEGERLRELDPYADRPDPSDATPREPTNAQKIVLDRLAADLETGTFQCQLLHGVTGSGKTEVYLQTIARARARGQGAMVLVPEIALTPQLANRFRARFGDEVAVLHSGLGPRERVDVWEHIRRGNRPIVIGARSAVFAPVPDLRVIVVDEEHDGSFKQEDGVRYNGRDVAVVRGRSLGALVVLGSATPSLETWDNARRGRYGWLRLDERPTPRPLPSVEILSLAVHRADPETGMTARLRDAVLETVEAKEQAILFLNRRGYTTTLTCLECGALQQCPDCSAPSMTYHLDRHRLVCHLCGHIENAPRRCLSCTSESLMHGQAGTERVEVAIAASMPRVSVLRLDRDSSRGRRLVDILDRFRAREADVLVGTQMLSKGHDFPGVTLVGILQGDHGLGLPDLRAAERTFQLLTQVAGRAGRGDRPGRVMVQAFAVDHPAIRLSATHDYEGFAIDELERRRPLRNPPHGHLALLRVQGPDAEAVRKRAEAVADRLKAVIRRINEQRGREDDGRWPVELLPPTPSPIERINRQIRWQMLLRARERPPLRFVLRGVQALLGGSGHGRSRTELRVDVDPQSLM